MTIPAASTETSVTSARPIISADAVEAVRCGLRLGVARARALRRRRRASPPASPSQVRERPDEPLREQCDAEEDHQRAEAHPDEQRGRARCPGRRAPRRGRRSREASGGSIPGRAGTRSGTAASVAPSRTAASGGTRVARKAGRRLATTRDEDARSERDHAPRSAVRMRPLFGSVKPDGVEEREQAFRQPDADREPDQRRQHADDERLDQDRGQDLPTRRADGAQGRELPRPLGDRDRERVGDHEAADEERDPAEGEQEAAQERDEAVRLRGVVLGLLRRRSSPVRSAGTSAWSSRTSLFVRRRPASPRPRSRPAGRACRTAPGRSAGRSRRAWRRRSSRRSRSGRTPRSGACRAGPCRLDRRPAVRA